MLPVPGTEQPSRTSLSAAAFALLNPGTFAFVQKRHLYTRNRKTSGDSKIVYLHCGDVEGTWTLDMRGVRRTRKRVHPLAQVL